MVLIRARFSEYLDQGATVAPLFGRERVSRHAHFLNRIRLRCEVCDPVPRITVQTAAVHLVLVLLLPLAGRIHLESRLRLKAILRARRAAPSKRAAASDTPRQSDD